MRGEGEMWKGGKEGRREGGREGGTYRVENAQFQQLAQEAFLGYFGDASNVFLRGLGELDAVDPFALRTGGREGGREGG